MIKKRYFFSCSNISSYLFFLFFNTAFCIGYKRTEKKYVKVIDDDIFNCKVEFKAKSETIQKNRNYKKVGKKILRIFKILSKFWFVQLGFWKYVFADNENLEITFSTSWTYFSCKLLCLLLESALPLGRNKFLLSIGASLVGKLGFSITHGNMWHIFQQSKIKIITSYLILVIWKDYKLRKNYHFCLSFQSRTYC